MVQFQLWMLGELISFGSPLEGDGKWQIYLRINKIIISGKKLAEPQEIYICDPKRAFKFAFLADGRKYLLMD